MRAPERASEAAQEAFLRAVLHRGGDRPRRHRARAADLGVDLDAAARCRRGAHHFAADRGRLADPRARRRRARRARRRAGSIAAIDDAAPTPRASWSWRPAADGAGARRTAEAVARELEATLHGFTFAVGTRAWPRTRSTSTGRATRRCSRPTSPSRRRRRRASRAAAVLAFEATGAYRLLLPAMSEDPGELQRFYAETVEPLVAYDDQYETDLVQTLETFLDCDGNVANTAQRLFTHRHTIRYRLERVRDLRARRRLHRRPREARARAQGDARAGHRAPRGPATERGARGGARAARRPGPP